MARPVSSTLNLRGRHTVSCRINKKSIFRKIENKHRGRRKVRARRQMSMAAEASVLLCTDGCHRLLSGPFDKITLQAAHIQPLFLTTGVPSSTLEKSCTSCDSQSHGGGTHQIPVQNPASPSLSSELVGLLTPPEETGVHKGDS